MSNQGVVRAPIPDAAPTAPKLALILASGPQKGLRVDCHRIVSLMGSREGCKIHVPDPRVSPAHVALVNDGTKITAIDLVTQSGTRLNGLPLEYEQLNSGDVIEIASWRFEVRIEREPNYTRADEHAMDLDPAPHTVAFHHVQSGRLLQPNRDICIVGRRPGCDIHVDDHRVSRAHALLVTYFDRPAIVDLLTSNGTIVNHESAAFRLLEDEDTIQCGDAEFRVHFGGMAAMPKTPSNGAVKKPTPAANGDDPDEGTCDMIDIAATEGSQRWRIAESAKKVARP